MIAKFVHLNLIVSLALLEAFTGYSSDCDYKTNLMIGEVNTVKSPYWPSDYWPGSSCQWTFDCPLAYICKLQCYLLQIPHSARCISDRLQVSTGTTTKMFCGQNSVMIKSTGTRIRLEFKSNKHSKGGRFKCTVQPEPLMYASHSDDNNLRRSNLLRLPKQYNSTPYTIRAKFYTENTFI